MTSDKRNISLLADLFVKKGLEHIVISPGSRNAPIVIGFANKPEVEALSIVDERSAAFFALGMAQQSGKAVAIACTSGSAALNYAPAIAEAYYQKIPLLVLTADRPPHMVDKGDGQTIRQKDVYANYVKKSFELVEHINTKDDIHEAESLINEALEACMAPEPGPVHINLPFEEPLYNMIEEGIEGQLQQYQYKDEQFDFKELSERFNESSKVLFVVGQMNPDPDLTKVLKSFSGLSQVTILSETTSNVPQLAFVDCIDNVISTIGPDETANFQPDLIISLGGQVVSKMIKKFLRKSKSIMHWHLSPSGELMDTYFQELEAFSCHPRHFLEHLLLFAKDAQSSFAELWNKRLALVRGFRDSFLVDIPYCDLQVFNTLMSEVPNGTILHLGNSTPVRYSQLFGSKPDIRYHSNRGVSGIDGQLSTASGAAFIRKDLQLMITGDLGFFYDSNALMNENLRANLRIIVINNGGGGIFRFIDGPAESQQLERFFETRHQWKAEQLAKAFDVEYHTTDNLEGLQTVLPSFLNEKSDRPALLEIFTPTDQNALVLRQYFKFLKESVASVS